MGYSSDTSTNSMESSSSSSMSGRNLEFNTIKNRNKKNNRRSSNKRRKMSEEMDGIKNDEDYETAVNSVVNYLNLFEMI